MDFDSIDDEFASLFLQELLRTTVPTQKRDDLEDYQIYDSQGEIHNHEDHEFFNIKREPVTPDSINQQVATPVSLSTFFKFDGRMNNNIRTPVSNVSTPNDASSFKENMPAAHDDIISRKRVFQEPNEHDETKFPLKKQATDSQEQYINDLMSLLPENNESKLKILDSSSNLPIDFTSYCRLHGKVYIDQDTSNNYKELSNFPTVTKNKSLKLICYRRNYLSLFCSFGIGTPQILDGINILSESGQLKRLKDIRIRLSSSLFNNDSEIVRPDGQENDFLVCKSDKKKASTDTVIVPDQNECTISIDQIKNSNDDLTIFWDRLTFKSSSASNKHDTDTKYYIITITIEFLDEKGAICKAQRLMSNQIVVRGRAPSFYVNKNDILISRLKESSKTVKERRKSENNHIRKAQGNMSVDFRSYNSNANTPINNDNNSNSSDETKMDDTVTIKETPGSPFPQNRLYSNSATPHDQSSSNHQLKSTYQYFKMDDNYYLPPVEIGYFPHHAHHNKQVFKPSTITSALNFAEGMKRNYNYFM